MDTGGEDLLEEDVVALGAAGLGGTALATSSSGGNSFAGRVRPL